MYTRGISTLLAIALLVPSAALAQEDGMAPTTEPVVETPTTITPTPTNVEIKPIRLELKRGEDLLKPEEGWSFGESNPQLSSPGKGGNQGRIAPTTTRPVLPEDRMLRRASGTPAIPEGTKDMIERREAARERIGTGTAPLDGKIRDRAEEAKTRLAEARAEQMKDFVRKTITRMRAAVERLSKLADRIDSRMEKIEAAQEAAKNASSTNSGGGVGKVNVQDISICLRCTGRARAALEEAKAALTEAEASFASYVPQAPEDGGNTPGALARPQPGMGQPSPMRDDLKRADAAIREAHKALIEAVASMRILPTVNKASDGTSGE